MNYANIFAKMFPERNFCKVNMFPERKFQTAEMFPERNFESYIWKGVSAYLPENSQPYKNIRFFCKRRILYDTHFVSHAQFTQWHLSLFSTCVMQCAAP